jgi:hypothetical protein
MQFVVVYMKVNEDKEKGLAFDGPFYGPIAQSQQEAKKAARELSNKTRSGAVVSRIFDIPPSASFSDAMIKARPIFERIRCDMVEAKEVVDRPVIKRKRKK